MTTKESLRKKMKSLRQELSRKEVHDRSDKIMENLLSLPEYFRADIVHSYISSKNNEVDTHELIRILLRQKKKVVVPVAGTEPTALTHSVLLSLSELVGGKYGILVPRMLRPAPLHELQAVIVPALAVDRNGNRLGFGAGYYDRFLSTVRVPTIILAYDFQVIEKVPVESTDIPVSFVITENEIIRCRNKTIPTP
jgi:5-formyltetrahydrofolate cyclo-ligase